MLCSIRGLLVKEYILLCDALCISWPYLGIILREFMVFHYKLYIDALLYLDSTIDPILRYLGYHVVSQYHIPESGVNTTTSPSVLHETS